MIYAIRAIGTEYVKFGKAKDPVRRLLLLQVGCPHLLEIESVADWPDSEEYAIHAYLTAIGAHHQGEWFKHCDEIVDIVATMRKGLRGWRDAIRSKAPSRLAHHLKLVANG